MLGLTAAAFTVLSVSHALAERLPECCSARLVRAAMHNNRMSFVSLSLGTAAWLVLRSRRGLQL
jgi:hypothetical protein